MQVVQFIQEKQIKIITCREEDTVQTAAMLLARNKIGAMPVLSADRRVVGIFSERDIVRAFAEQNMDVNNVRVSELMSRNIVACAPGDDMTAAQQLMKQHGVRHLPVMDGGELLGFISIRDALEVVLRDREMEANVMRDISIAARAR